MTIPNPVASAQNVRIMEADTSEAYRAFAEINHEWVARYFTVESEDARLFADPKAHIVAPGGVVFIAWENDRAIGAAALIPIAQGDFEFSKMGVTEAAQGKGVGHALLTTAIEWAKIKSAKKLLICTSSTLATANRMYRRFGFVDSTDPRHHLYDRADVFLELPLIS